MLCTSFIWMSPGTRGTHRIGISCWQAWPYLSTRLPISRKLSTLFKLSIFPGHEPIPFHATDIRNGKKFWRRQDKTVRTSVLQDIAAAIRQAPAEHLVLFGSVVAKSAAFYGEAAVHHAAAQVCKRFDTFLKRRYQEHNDPQRGLLVFAQGNFSRPCSSVDQWLPRTRDTVGSDQQSG